MLTWRWIGTRRDGFWRPVVPQSTVAVVGEGRLRDHSSSHASPVVRCRGRQVRYARLAVCVVVGRAAVVVVPRRRVGRVVTPALREALVAADGGVDRATGAAPTRCSCGRRRGGDAGAPGSSRVVLVLRLGSHATACAGRGSRRPEAQRRAFALVPG